MTRAPLRLAVLAALAYVLSIGTATAQPCLTCRTEACQDKAGLAAWCGAGKDPTRARPRHARRLEGIAIVSQPPGALVWLDDHEQLGTTPLADLKLSHGAHTLSFALEGYEGVRLSVAVQQSGQRFETALVQKVLVKEAPPPSEPSDVAPPPVTPPPAEHPIAPPPAPRPPTLEEQMDATLRKMPSQAPPAEVGTPLYRRWWLWTAVGAVAAGVVLGGVLGARPWVLPAPADVHDLRGKL